MNTLKIFDTAAVSDYSDLKYRVNYISISSINWVVVERTVNHLPLSSSAADIIRQKLNEGKEVFIDKNWNEASKEVLPFHITFNDITDLEGYKRRARSFVKRFIIPQMAEVNASVIYGFNVINNKFLEAGVVFSEKNRSLKYIEVMEKADEADENGHPEIAESLMNLLEQYIEYRETLDRSYFIWDLSEKYCKKIDDVVLKVFSPEEYELLLDKETASEDNILYLAKSNIDTIVREFTQTVDSLNNLK